MNTDIRIKTTFPHHIKTRKLIKKLGFKGFYSLICLWCYAAVNKPKGILDIPIEDIAIAADWDEDPETFVDALTRCGFLEKDDGGQIILHDWVEHNAFASHAEKRNAKAVIAASIRWGGKNLGELLRHPNPLVRSEAARLLRQRRYEKEATQTQKNDNVGLHAGGDVGSESLDTTGFDATRIASSNAPSPIPIPSPSPNPYIGMDSHDVCTQSDKSDFVPSNSKIIFSEKDMTFLNLEPYIAKWQAAYPAINVLQELKAMEAWVASQPKSRWKKDWRRFITNWLSREQDKAELRMAKAGGNGRRFLDD
ncbi:MAG: hypothetical protein QXQ02_02545 [Halobacteria archaeon]